MGKPGESMTRGEFLKLSGLAALGFVLGACGPTSVVSPTTGSVETSPSPNPKLFDLDKYPDEYKIVKDGCTMAIHCTKEELEMAKAKYGGVYDWYANTFGQPVVREILIGHVHLGPGKTSVSQMLGDQIYIEINADNADSTKSECINTLLAANEMSPIFFGFPLFASNFKDSYPWVEGISSITTALYGMQQCQLPYKELRKYEGFSQMLPPQKALKFNIWDPTSNRDANASSLNMKETGATTLVSLLAIRELQGSIPQSLAQWDAIMGTPEWQSKMTELLKGISVELHKESHPATFDELVRNMGYGKQLDEIAAFLGYYKAPEGSPSDSIVLTSPSMDSRDIYIMPLDKQSINPLRLSVDRTKIKIGAANLTYVSQTGETQTKLVTVGVTIGTDPSFLLRSPEDMGYVIQSITMAAYEVEINTKMPGQEKVLYEHMLETEIINKKGQIVAIELMKFLDQNPNYLKTVPGAKTLFSYTGPVEVP